MASRVGIRAAVKKVRKFLDEAQEQMKELEEHAPSTRGLYCARLARMWMTLATDPAFRELGPAEMTRELVDFAGMMAAPFIGRNEAVGLLMDGYTLSADRSAQIEKAMKKQRAEREKQH